MSDFNNTNEKVGFCSECGSAIQPNSKFCPKCGKNVVFLNSEPNTASIHNTTNSHPNGHGKKNWLVTFFLSFLLGGLGAHRFYTGKIGTGVLMLFTIGGFGLWWLIDFITVASGYYKDKDGFRLEKGKNSSKIAWISFAVIILTLTMLIVFVPNSLTDNLSSSPSGNLSSSSKRMSMSKDEYIALCQSYNYEDISRNPNTYMGKESFFTGEVIQVMESRNNVTLRVNVTEGRYSWSDTIYVDYTRLDNNEPRILEKDIIKIYGDLNGLKSYTSALRTTITIPWIIAYYIER